MISTIAARVCGTDYACAIPRDRLHLFEGLHGSAVALLTRIRAGNWTADELRAVIDFSISPPPASSSFEGAFLRNRSDKPSVAGDAFVQNGPAVYAPLAALILFAALYGVPEEASTFTDEADGEDA
ncbi:MAG: hypothetical protein QHC90_23195 [Shinella sp.]|nr:hypothetical protein [Shinella sp.]